MPPGIGVVLASKDWVKHVPSNMVKTAAKYASLDAFMSANGELQGRLSDAIYLPGEKASDKGRAKFWNRIGRSETPEGYKAPELEGETFEEGPANAFFGKAHELGLTQIQIEALMAWEAASQKAASANTRMAAASSRMATLTLIMPRSRRPSPPNGHGVQLRTLLWGSA